MSLDGAYTPFQEPWWLEALAPGRWDVVEVDQGGTTVARLPYVVEERLGTRVLTQPVLTQSLGPWVRPTGASSPRELGRQMDLFQQLINGLPRHDVFSQGFAPAVTNWLPFYWQGFEQTTRYTYQLDVTQSPDQVLARMDKRNRRQLRAANKLVVAEVQGGEGSADGAPEGALEELLALNRLSFARQGLRPPYTPDEVRALDQAIAKNAKRWVILARDVESGRAVNGIYLLAAGDAVYSLLSGADPKRRHLGGGMVARQASIEVAHRAGAVLDLQGSMLRGVERRNRNYGATQVPYFVVTRSNGVLERRSRQRELLRAPLLAAWRAKNRVVQSWAPASHR